MATKAPKPTPKYPAEVLELNTRMKALKDATGITQGEFAKRFKIGKNHNQSAVSMFLGGTPLSIDAAKGFAKGFGCSVREISPRIADLLTESPEQAQAPMDHAEALGVLAGYIRAATPLRREQVALLFARLVTHPEQVGEITEAFSDLLKIGDRPTPKPAYSASGPGTPDFVTNLQPIDRGTEEDGDSSRTPTEGTGS